LIDVETGEVTNKDSYKRLPEIEYFTNGKVWILYTNKALFSSHYYSSYRKEMKRDFLEFNFQSRNTWMEPTQNSLLPIRMKNV